MTIAKDMEFSKKRKALKKPEYLMLAVLCSFISGLSSAAEYSGQYFYRYVDKNGETVIATQVPKEATSRGYDILTDSGRLLESVAPKISDEALQIQKLQNQLSLQKKFRAKKKSYSDEELLRLYKSVDDVEFAQRRDLQKIDSRALVLTGNIERLELRLERRQDESEQAKRRGKKVPANIVTEMNNIESELAQIEMQAEQYEKEKEELRTEYAKKIKRVRFLVEGEQVTRNDNLLFTDQQVVGSWLLVGEHSSVMGWKADAGGVFVAQVTKSKRMTGNWSLSRDGDIVVVYFRQQTDIDGKEKQKTIAREVRYPVLDYKDGILTLFWDGRSTQFKPAK